MLFPDDFIEKLPNDLIEAGELICKIFYDAIDNAEISHESLSLEEFLEAFILLDTFVKANSLDDSFDIFELSDDDSSIISFTYQYYSNFRSHIKTIKQSNYVEFLRFKFSSQLNLAFAYNFTDGDIQKIQALINELRDLIGKSDYLGDNHKNRLLNKLESLQKELHKKMSSLEKFYVFVGDLGILLGKFGQDAKPLVDLIEKIIKIAWNAEAVIGELPSGSSMPILDK